MLALSDSEKKDAWKFRYERLLNVENAWEENFPTIDPTEGLATRVNTSMIIEAIKDMKTRKAPGPSGITTEMLKISGGVGYGLVTNIVNRVIQESDAPNDWCSSILVKCYTLDRNYYRGIKLLDQIMKITEGEKVIAQLIRNRIRLDEMQAHLSETEFWKHCVLCAFHTHTHCFNSPPYIKPNCFSSCTMLGSPPHHTASFLSLYCPSRLFFTLADNS
ncbi:uncharacterized protein LOC118765482 [Octopus sinensis]|uniref:Uncharacterized protein LOC118765482 n=1 Tax=Octopus sinensis TaxID=2607531 RepID=A0A7E6F9G5_9MOLL|nr:uncharacterized protein LOC118765482 [Octopus sinensis]